MNLLCFKIYKIVVYYIHLLKISFPLISEFQFSKVPPFLHFCTTKASDIHCSLVIPNMIFVNIILLCQLYFIGEQKQMHNIVSATFFSTSQLNNKSLHPIYPPHPIFDKYIPLTNETQSELWISYLNNVKMLITVHTDSWQWAASILTYTSGQVSPPSHLCAMSLTNGRSSDLGITCLKWSKSWRRVDCSPKLRRWKTASLKL